MMRALERPSVELMFLLQDVEDPVNVGSAFRIADAAGAKEILLCGIAAKPPHKLITKVGRAKDQRIKWQYFEDPLEALAAARTAGFTPYALEVSAEATPYHLVQYAPKTCIVVGHEDHGITKKMMAQIQERIFIPMYGKGASLNVHVALGVLAFHALHGVDSQGAPG